MSVDRRRISHCERSARRGTAREARSGLIIISLCLLGVADAQTQIHKCTDADGGVEYSQLPCVPKKSAEPENSEPDAEAESEPPKPDQQELSAREIPKEEPEMEVSRAACKKRYRDAIDAIDAEIGREYSPDKAEEFKQRLLQLTRKLRQC